VAPESVAVVWLAVAVGLGELGLGAVALPEKPAGLLAEVEVAAVLPQGSVGAPAEDAACAVGEEAVVVVLVELLVVVLPQGLLGAGAVVGVLPHGLVGVLAADATGV
jgi:hypothetical protein